MARPSEDSSAAADGQGAPPQLGGLAKGFFDVIGEPIPDRWGYIAESFDWSACGVQHPYLMFITGRCGSTWLTSLLGATEAAGWPDEFFNSEVAAKWRRQSSCGFIDYFMGCVEAAGKNGRFGAQIDAARIIELRDFVRLPGLFPPDRVTTFFLFRHDIIAQAWSWVCARNTGVWHSIGIDQSPDALDYGGPSHDELSREIIRIREYEEFLEGYFQVNGYSPTFVSYEGLVANPTGTLAMILAKLGVSDADVESACRSARSEVQRLRYVDRDRRLAFYEACYPDLFNRLRQSRFGVSSVAIRQVLLGW